jgi:hypothetical protein
MVLESNQSITGKKVTKVNAAIYDGVTKVGNYVSGFTTNNSVISHNISGDKTLSDKNTLNKKQLSQKLQAKQITQQLAQNQISFTNNFIIEDGANPTIPIKQPPQFAQQ